MRVIEQSAWRAQRWKNGRGVTHEVWRTPDVEPGELQLGSGYDLRVSVAELDNAGQFSEFAGYRRWSFLVGSAPLELFFDQRSELAALLTAPGEHVELPSTVQVMFHCPAGQTHLLNILARVPIVAGYGPADHPVRFVFALTPRPAVPALARWASAVLDPPAVIDTTDCIWIS